MTPIVLAHDMFGSNSVYFAAPDFVVTVCVSPDSLLEARISYVFTIHETVYIMHRFVNRENNPVCIPPTRYVTQCTITGYRGTLCPYTTSSRS